MGICDDTADLSLNIMLSNKTTAIDFDKIIYVQQLFQNVTSGNLLFGGWNRNIPEQLSSLHHQVISSYGIGYVG